MSTIKIECVDQTLHFTNVPAIYSGDVNYDKLEVEFDSSWNNYTKTAIFYRSKDEVYYQVINSGSCTIPKEVLKEKGYFYIGLFGAYDDSVVTTEIKKYKVSEGAITEDLETPDPNPDIWEQILADYGSLRRELIDLQNDYISTKRTLQADYTTTKNTLDSDYEDVKSDLESDYTSTKSTLASDYSSTKSSLQADYNTTKGNLQSDYTATKTALNNDYNTIKGTINNKASKSWTYVGDAINDEDPITFTWNLGTMNEVLLILSYRDQQINDSMTMPFSLFSKTTLLRDGNTRIVDVKLANNVVNFDWKLLDGCWYVKVYAR